MGLSHLPIKLAVHCAASKSKLKSDNKIYGKSLFVISLKSTFFGKFTHTFSPDAFLFGVVRVELMSGVAKLVEIMSLTGVVLMS